MDLLNLTSSAWQHLFDIYLVLGVIAGVVTVGFLLYFALRYRGTGPAVVRGGEGGGKVAVIIVVLMAIALVIAAYSSIGVIQYQSTPPDPAIHINVIGRQWAWGFQYPDGREVWGVLRIPANTTVVLNVTSVDVFHNFGIPAFRVKADAVPGYYETIWLVAPSAGTYPIFCYELCGAGHTLMTANLVVMNQSSYLQWYDGGGS
ncbi:MAG: cytochrome c oxidase subunit II [Nitrososphaerota archaeon]|nr:cytochrome c oxidase subunit II [Nitrososphaerota archaeon]